MCVIIIVPKGNKISKSELKKAWAVNSDGAGYCIAENGTVMYQRGFMSFNHYWEAIRHKLGRADMILHLRISTSDKVNKLQTHPYEVGRKTKLKGITKNPVVCMNGVIWGQTEYKGLNDTMSYIEDHIEVFKLFKELTANKQLINLIASDSGAKWAVMTPQGFEKSNEFKEYKGRFYSNFNHLTTTKRKTYRHIYTNNPADYLTSYMLSLVKQDPNMYQELKDFINTANIWELEELQYIYNITELKDFIRGGKQNMLSCYY